MILDTNEAGSKDEAVTVKGTRNKPMSDTPEGFSPGLIQ